MRGQLWIIPFIVSALALLLAHYLLTNGATLLTLEEIDHFWLYSGDPSSARELLSSLLTGLITMVSLVVSITFLILTLAANQLGPRLISAFIGDRQIQTVLGLFLGTTLYVLIVLRTVDDTLGAKGVPHVAITAGSALTIVCLFALVLYLHKVARSIIADNVISRVARDLTGNLRSILPDMRTQEAPTSPVDLGPGSSISLERAGYIQTIDYDALVDLAKRRQLVFTVRVRAGHFVLKHGDHVRCHPEQTLAADDLSRLRRAFTVGEERTPAQDLEYGFGQLVEVAVRALSPGINDPFTALAVVDRLGAALEDMLERQLPSPIWRDDDGTVRLCTNRSDMAGIFAAAFDLIRETAARHPAILIRMADVIGQLAPAIRTAEDRSLALVHLQKLRETTQQDSLAPSDADDVMRRIEAAEAAVSSRVPD
jgi:uncharacterized membrane protein